MKLKILITLLLALVIPFALQAQFSVKPSVGVNFANVDGPDVSGASFFNGGGSFVYEFDSPVSVEFGAFYFGRGAKAEKTKTDVEFRYAEVPVSVRIGNVGVGPVSFYAFGGGSFGYLLTAGYDDQGEHFDVKDEVDSFNVSVSAGIGGSYPAFGNNVEVEARVNSGVKKVYAGRETKDFVVSVGYRFEL